MIQNPWLLLLPVLFDLFYWFAPPLILGPELVTILLTPFDPQGANAALLATRPELMAEFPALYESMEELVSEFNLWQFFISSYLFWPTILAGQVPDAESISAMQKIGWQLTNFGHVALSLIGVIVVGLFFNVFWLHGIAYSVQKKENGIANLATLLRQTAQHGLRLLIMGLVFLTIFFGGLFPLSFVLAVIMLLLPGVGACLYSIAIVLILWLLFWLAIHLYFTVAAVIVADQSLLQAPWLSIRLVRRFFRSGLGFILICTLLTWGFQVVWNGFSSEIGRLVSIIGNAALGTAIAAAMMIFFGERYPMLIQESKTTL